MNSEYFSSSRRRFLTQAGVFAASTFAGVQACSKNEDELLFNQIGTTGDPSRALALKKQGIQFMTASTSKFLIPDKGDDVFSKNLEALKACPLPILACNGFIRPRHLRCTGKEANHDEVLAWADTCFRRLKQAGGKFIVFGSAGSRELRNGWTVEQADPQFVTLLKRMGPLAKKQGIMIVVEQLNTKECNYINRIEHSARLIREVNHPSVRILADIYHMALDGDTPADLEKAMDVVAHIEIAEKQGRTYPGVRGQDFTPFFKVLKDAGYKGLINIEGRGKVEQLTTAIKTIRAHEAKAIKA